LPARPETSRGVEVHEETHESAWAVKGPHDRRSALLQAAMKALGSADKQEVGRWANNRVENSHLPFGSVPSPVVTDVRNVPRG
jgi:hypothetical protein